MTPVENLEKRIERFNRRIDHANEMLDRMQPSEPKMDDPIARQDAADMGIFVNHFAGVRKYELDLPTGETVTIESKSKFDPRVAHKILMRAVGEAVAQLKEKEEEGIGFSKPLVFTAEEVKAEAVVADVKVQLAAIAEEKAVALGAKVGK